MSESPAGHSALERTPEHQQAAQEFSQQLAGALASRWRSRVWSALLERPMGPSQFVKEVGGNKRHIRRCFSQLEEWGFIEVIETSRSGGRGRAERIFRAVRRAWIGTELAAHIPVLVREEISVHLLVNHFRNLAQAIGDGSLDAGADFHLSSDQLPLDLDAWEDLVTRVDATLHWLSAMQTESAERLAASGEAPALTTVALLGFKSPSRAATATDGSAQAGGLVRPLTDGDPTAEILPVPFLSSELAKAMRSPLRARILAEATIRPISPSTFTEEFGGDLEYVGRCFRQLTQAGYLELISQRRGGPGSGPAAVEHVYRSVRKARIPKEIWTIPPTVADEATAGQVSLYLRRIVDATEAGTFDADPARHLSWDILVLDRRAREELIARFEELQSWAADLGIESAHRQAATPGKGITATMSLAAFRSPRNLVRVRA